MQRWLKQGSVLAVLLAASGVQAEDKPKETVKPAPPKAQPSPPDAEFLEFLANWDSEDEDWNNFLASSMEKEKQAKAKTEAARKAESK